MVVAFWLIGCIVLNTLLEATICAKLSVVDVPVLIENLRDMSKHPDKIWMGTRLGISRYMESSENSVEVKIWKRILETNQMYDINDISEVEMNAISEGERMMIGEINYVLTWMVGIHCKNKIQPFHVGREPFFAAPGHTYYRKGLDLSIAEPFIIGMTEILERGLSVPVTRASYRDALPCFKEGLSRSHIHSDSLTMYKLRRIFQLLVLGHSVATAVFIIEFISKRFWTDRKTFR